MVPTPGGKLDDVNTALADPLFQIVARLAKGPIGNQDGAIVLADLVEADFPGYAAIPLVADLTNPVEIEGYGEMTPQLLNFEAGAIVTPQNITHIYYTKTYNGGGLSLVSAVCFDNPITMEIPGQQLQLLAAVGAF